MKTSSSKWRTDPGENPVPTEGGLPVFAKLEKVKVEKKLADEPFDFFSSL